MGNLGHRLGGDFTGENPNSVESMEAAWFRQTSNDFEYWELDVVETKDQKICVIHDRDLPDGRDVRDLTFAEIYEAEPRRVTLEQLFEAFRKLDQQRPAGLGLRKPIIVEIKRLYTDMGRHRLINCIKNGRIRIQNVVPVHCISFDGPKFVRPTHFRKSFPKDRREFWGKQFRNHRINVLKIGNKDKDLFGNPIYKKVYLHSNYPVEPYKPTKEKKSLWKRIKSWFRGLF